MDTDEDWIDSEANVLLLRLIPEAYRTVPTPDAVRLGRIEEEVLRRAVRCRAGAAVLPPPPPPVRRIPWWLLGLGLVAATAAAAWWVGGHRHAVPHSAPAALSRPQPPISPALPAAADPSGQKRPQSPAIPPPDAAPAPPKSPVVFRR